MISAISFAADAFNVFHGVVGKLYGAPLLEALIYVPTGYPEPSLAFST
ncbi:hypothetical protein JMUB7555_01880 [Staphylococcus aureus]|nr:hypothetical protein SA231_21310 [Staphylococcus aureus]